MTSNPIDDNLQIQFALKKGQNDSERLVFNLMDAIAFNCLKEKKLKFKERKLKSNFFAVQICKETIELRIHNSSTCKHWEQNK